MFIINHQLYILQECFLTIKNQIAITTPDARNQSQYDSVIYLHFQEKKALELCTNRLWNISFGQSLTHNIENPNVNMNTSILDTLFTVFTFKKNSRYMFTLQGAFKTAKAE